MIVLWGRVCSVVIIIHSSTCIHGLLRWRIFFQGSSLFSFSVDRDDDTDLRDTVATVGRDRGLLLAYDDATDTGAFVRSTLLAGLLIGETLRLRGAFSVRWVRDEDSDRLIGGARRRLEPTDRRGEAMESRVAGERVGEGVRSSLYTRRSALNVGGVRGFVAACTHDEVL
ncbi:hypothetical protein PFISCL1PPCAC_11469, partial [Pristionchus fissidentatus]